MQHGISIILLASGLSKRTGNDDKLLLPYNDKPLLQHSINLLSALSVYEKILVSTIEKLKHVHVTDGIKVMLNKNPQKGQSESIKLGLKIATGSAYMFMVADQPKLTIDDIMPLIKASKQFKNEIIYPTIGGSPTNPTIFPARFKNELLALTEDRGGRDIRNNNPDSRVPIEVENPDNFLDVDTMKDYYKLFAKEIG